MGATVEVQAPVSTKDRLKSAKLPERTVDICLRADLQAEWEDLHRELAAAETAQSRDKRLNTSGGRVKKIGEQITALEAEMRSETIVFRMRALSKRAWTELLKKHPARQNHDEDEHAGFNTDTFIAAAIRACTYSPDDLDDATWTEMLNDTLTEHQYFSLQDAVMALNVRRVSVPNSFAASRILQGSSPG